LNTARLPDPTFWANKRVLLTGHTGFKGSWAALWLAAMGAKVTGFALVPDTDPALFQLAGVGRDLLSFVGDLRDADAVAAAVRAADPQIVIHMAAQALVRRSIADPVATFAANVQGTVNLLDALRTTTSLRAVLVVTSDKVYANDGRGRPFVETDSLGGRDPYSASKAATEIATHAYAISYFEPAGIRVATARAGNIIGGGDFSADRLVPDLVRAVGARARLKLRHPMATRPWQHVLDCVDGYLRFAEALASDRAVPAALNFGPSTGEQVTAAALANALFRAFGCEPAWDHVPDENSIEVLMLALDASDAGVQLGWRNRLNVETAIRWTADWYRAQAAGEDVRAVTLEQISAYCALPAEAA
jgi:CDP-glucose 4,6-dehydratase